MSKIQSIADDLRKEQSRLIEERNTVQARLEEMDAEIKRVEDALTALGQKTKQTKAKKSGKPAPKREEVEQAVREILSEQGALELDPLKTQVGAKLTELGRSKMGLALRLKEVLAGEQFIESPAGWKLVESDAATLA